ncbi:tyrosine-type recombinase/integrase [Pseudomonas sp. TWP3-2]|uniref:tyrosine-type recombinase/integrase n=1 Tax=Pseudomonas sp. TWP3-2 TaxID=2804574 RepID=UPI003CECBAC9
MAPALREFVAECMRSPVACPYLTHYSPKARKRSQLDSTPYWSAVTPDYLTKSFAQARDDSEAYKEVPPGVRPTLHEIRALGAWQYEQQGFPQEYIQELLGHADIKMTEHYRGGHGDDAVVYMKVSAELKALLLHKVLVGCCKKLRVKILNQLCDTTNVMRVNCEPQMEFRDRIVAPSIFDWEKRHFFWSEGYRNILGRIDRKTAKFINPHVFDEEQFSFGGIYSNATGVLLDYLVN